MTMDIARPDMLQGQVSGSMKDRRPQRFRRQREINGNDNVLGRWYQRADQSVLYRAHELRMACVRELPEPPRCHTWHHVTQMLFDF